ncbi:hypothetical protein QYF36_015327 [Acer negundo]|nr:hypothetical protein QYF36_015327 [Acer negundo]
MKISPSSATITATVSSATTTATPGCKGVPLLDVECALSIEKDRFTSVYQYERGPCSCPLPLAPCFKVRVTVDGHAFESPDFFKSRKAA